MPVTVCEYVPQLEDTGGKQIKDHHQGKTDVESPKSYFDQLFCLKPHLIALHRPHRENKHPESKHAEYAKHCRVSVIGGQCCPHLKIGNNGGVDEEPEDTGTHEVPCSHRNEEVNGPFLL